MERVSLTSRLDDLFRGYEEEIDHAAVQQLIRAQVEALRARIEKLESHTKPIAPPPEREDAISRRLRRYPTAHVNPVQPGPPRTTHPQSMPDAYHATAGRDLDLWIHKRVFGGTADLENCPPYSTDLAQAKKLSSRLRSRLRVRVLFGRTTLSERPWFARVPTEDGRGAEVLAETLPLALCRLALLRMGE